jgi:hypothetical protein
MYIESPDRSAGIRLDTSTAGTNYTFGEAVSVCGIIKTTAAGEKYIALEAMGKSSDVRPPEALGMSNRAAAEAEAAGLFVKLWGKAGDIATNSFTITDGSGTPITVYCSSLTKPADGAYIKIKGILSVESGKPVLLMRDEQVDWANATDDQPSAFAGKLKAFTDLLVIGPFTDSYGPGEVDNRLSKDYISDITGATITEQTVAPSAGDYIGTNQWVRYSSVGNTAPFSDLLGTATECAFYVHLYVWSPVYQSIDLLVGSDDGFMAWVNGAWVGSNNASRGLSYDQNILHADLNPGVNSLLFKIINVSASYGFAGRIAELGTAIEGQPGTGVPVKGLGFFLNKRP